MIANEVTLDWMRHRVGVKRRDTRKNKYITHDLRSSRAGADLIDTFGESTIRAFCGFIDLRDYSEFTCGKSPSEAAGFIKPFLNKVVGACLENGGIVDKTIGDEIMFVLPDMSDEGGHPQTLAIDCLNTKLLQLQQELGDSYRFRIGLSYGEMELMRICIEDFEEWSVVGEAVNLAKRLQRLDELEKKEEDHAYCGAFGMLGKQDKYALQFDVIMKYLAGRGTMFLPQPVPKPQALNGISEYRCAVFFPQSSENVSLEKASHGGVPELGSLGEVENR